MGESQGGGLEQHLFASAPPPPPSMKKARDKAQFVVDLRAEIPELSWQPSTNARRRIPYRIAKRALDLVASLVIIVILSPVLLVLALAMKLSSTGPIFFRQERVGRHGKVFVMLKVRTMTNGTDESLHRTHYEDLTKGNGDHKKMLIEADPRVTRIGTFLRKWSLDELPNLWNVLKGDMSLVGPRPLVPYEMELYVEEQLRRLKVSPGMTGLAQVRGRLRMSMDERANHDLEYVDRCSFWYDVGLLVRTIPSLLIRPGM